MEARRLSCPFKATGFCKPVFPVRKTARCPCIPSKEGCTLKERFQMLLFCPKGEEGEGRRVWLTQADRVLYRCCRHRCCLLLQAAEGCLSGMFTGSAACWTVKSDFSFWSFPFFLFFLLPQYNSTRPLPVLHFSNVHPSLSLSQSEVFYQNNIRIGHMAVGLLTVFPQYNIINTYFV